MIMESRKPIHHKPKDTGLNHANAQEKHTIRVTKVVAEASPCMTVSVMNTDEYADLSTIHGDLQKILALLTAINEKLKR